MNEDRKINISKGIGIVGGEYERNHEAIKKLVKQMNEREVILVVPDDQDLSVSQMNLIRNAQMHGINIRVTPVTELRGNEYDVVICGADEIANHERLKDAINRKIDKTMEEGFLDPIRPKLVHDFAYKEPIKLKPSERFKGKNPMGTGPGFKTRHHRKK